MYHQADWRVQNHELTEDKILVATKDGLPKAMKDDMEYKDQDQYNLPHEEWCDLIYYLEGNYARNMDTYQIKILASQKAAPESYSKESLMVPHKKEARTGVMPARNPNGKFHKNSGT